jgi:GntR family transcriptional repressor for pyruvate dehydrogenase complex
MIVKGDLRPGEMLPSQAKLADQFSASVTIIREATQILKAQGLVNVVHGKGAIVLSPDVGYAISMLRLLTERRMTTLMEVWELRHFLEEGNVALAAERATAEDLDDLEELLTQARQILDDPEEVYRAELKFHKGLAKAAHNTVLELMMEIISVLLEETLKSTDFAALSHGVDSHAVILQAVRARDGDAAREAMYRHLNAAQRNFFRGSGIGEGNST